MADVALDGVTKRFGTREAVSDLSLTIASGEFLVLLGPTGAGKTTTLRLVAGLERPDAGRISIGGRDVTAETPAARDVAFVFQQYSLYPHLSVFDNLAFPLRSPARRLPEPEVARQVREVARLLRIDDKLANRATQLSGGQMQRVAIGRALVRRPSVYLMDEPLSSLDAKLRADLRVELKRIQADFGATVLYVTHDQIEAMTLASRVGVIHDGRLAQIGSPREIYEDPADAYVATRLGSPGINLVPRSLLPAIEAPPETATIGARTEHVRLSKTGPGAPGKVTWIEHLGDQNHLHVALGESLGPPARAAGAGSAAFHDLVTLGDPDADLAVGDAVAVDVVRPLFFDGAGRRLGRAAA